MFRFRFFFTPHFPISSFLDFPTLIFLYSQLPNDNVRGTKKSPIFAKIQENL